MKVTIVYVPRDAKAGSPARKLFDEIWIYPTGEHVAFGRDGVPAGETRKIVFQTEKYLLQALGLGGTDRPIFESWPRSVREVSERPCIYCYAMCGDLEGHLRAAHPEEK